MLTTLLHTHADWASLVLRLVLALVIFPHGAQKVLGWFGGYGYTGTMRYFTTQAGLPAPVAFTVLMTEFVGPLLLVAGLGTRVIAVLIAAVMVGAIFKVHKRVGFFMNWTGQAQAGQEGFEYHLLVLAITAALLVTGGGAFSIDGLIAG
ncbi:MAG TPA: DoxX family protein [Gemmatimonadales bacterium]|nr:DoxX family protein [Gemmatimonadales bacterium]